MSNSPTPEQLKQAAHKANQMQREVMGLNNLDELREKIIKSFVQNIYASASVDDIVNEQMRIFSHHLEQAELQARIDEAYLIQEKQCSKQYSTAESQFRANRKVIDERIAQLGKADYE